MFDSSNVAGKQVRFQKRIIYSRSLPTNVTGSMLTSEFFLFFRDTSSHCNDRFDYIARDTHAIASGSVTDLIR